MRALVALAGLAAIGTGAGVAHGEPKPLVTAPVGWRADLDQATALAAKLNALPHLGVARSLATAEVFVPDAHGAVLFVTAVAAKVTTQRDAAARVAVDELHGASHRAALAGSGSGIVEDSWQERVDPTAKQIDATLSWRDTGAAIVTHARIVIAADAENLVAVTGECVASAAADAKLVTACKLALTSLDTGFPPGKRVALSLPPPGTQPPTEQHMTDSTHAPLPPMQVPQEVRSTDRRPVYVGAGIVVLAALFWWNRRRRARLEKESHE